MPKPAVKPEHPLRHCAHIDWMDYCDEKPRPQAESFKCPRCKKPTTKNICNGGTKADTAYCSQCRVEFAIIPTWHERLLELEADKPGKILRDDSNTIRFTLTASNTASNFVTFSTASGTGASNWTAT